MQQKMIGELLDLEDNWLDYEGLDEGIESMGVCTASRARFTAADFIFKLFKRTVKYFGKVDGMNIVKLDGFI